MEMHRCKYGKEWENYHSSNRHYDQNRNAKNKGAPGTHNQTHPKIKNFFEDKHYHVFAPSGIYDCHYTAVHTMGKRREILVF